MKHIIQHLIAPIAFFFLALGVGNGQDCYELLEDPSGYNSGALNPTIEAAACELRDALPTEFQSDFKVFDAGFYIETEFFGSSDYVDRFEELKAEAASKSPYYLLFGRKCNTQGLNVDVYADLVLPNSGELVCLNESLQTLNLSIHTTKMQEDLEGIKGSEQYVPAVLNFMNNVANDIQESVVCCDTITEKYKEGCDDNCMNGQVLVGALKGIGFDQIIADSIIITNTTYAGALESNYGVIFEFVNGSFSYTDELSSFLNSVGGTGKVRMYNDSTCHNFDFNLTLGGGYTENVIIVNKDGVTAVLMRDNIDGEYFRRAMETRSPLVAPIITWMIKKAVIAAANGAVTAMFEMGIDLGLTWIERGGSFEDTWEHTTFDKWALTVSASKEAFVSLLFGSNKAVDIAGDVFVSLAQDWIKADHSTYDLNAIASSLMTASFGAIAGPSLGKIFKKLKSILKRVKGDDVAATMGRVRQTGIGHKVYNAKAIRALVAEATWRIPGWTTRGFEFEHLLVAIPKYDHFRHLGRVFPGHDYYDNIAKEFVQLKTTVGKKVPNLKGYLDAVENDFGNILDGEQANKFKLIVIIKNTAQKADIEKDLRSKISIRAKSAKDNGNDNLANALKKLRFEVDVYNNLDD